MSKEYVTTLKEAKEKWEEIPIGKAKNITNIHFNKLLPIYRTKNNGSNTSWVCKCDCGNYIQVNAGHLQKNHTTSCGCYQKERASKTHLKDLTGQSFGKWKVLRRDNNYIRLSDGDIRVKWICECTCSKHTIKSIFSDHLTRGLSQSCGCIGNSLGEEKISQILKENNIIFEQQKTFETCRFEDTKALARFDFYLPQYNCIIEYDGEQHFKYTGYDWNTKENFEKTQEHDNYKNQWCKNNNIKIIRIPYTDFNKLNFNLLKEKGIEN